MMDLSSYFEEQYEAAIKHLPEEPKPVVSKEQIPLVEKEEIPVSYTNEEIGEMFFDFEKEKAFIGKFKGQGFIYNHNGEDIKTWSFRDQAGKIWLIPQWLIMDVPQGTFKGFTKEDPEENFIYYIEYLEFIKTEKGGRHNIKIFRKLSE